MAESELGEVARFLGTVFGVGESHRMFQPDVLRWKCCVPHPFWQGSRGYALRYKGGIAAFGCLVPIRFLTGSGTVASCNVIDWAASKTIPGAGVTLYRHIQGLTGTMINIGGTSDARQVLPQIGFEVRADIHHYTRVLRPWRHFRMDDRRDWKSPLRLVRDYSELMRATRGEHSLIARRITSFESVSAAALPDPSVTRQIVCARTPESLDYFMACPAAQVDAYLLERGSAAVGYFLLSRVGCQCRVADLWIRSMDQQQWAEGYAAAAAVARQDPEITEITAAASLALAAGALQKAGFRPTHTEPVFVLDPDRLLAGRNDLAVGLLENDAFYWSAGGVSLQAG